MGTHLPQKSGGSPHFSAHVLWPNGWMDQAANWYGGRPRPRPHCVRWRPAPPKRRHSPQFSAHVCCGKTAGLIKVPLGTKACVGPGDIVLDGDPAPPHQKRGTTTNFRPMSIVAKRSAISATAEHLLLLESIQSHSLVCTLRQETSPNFLRHRTTVYGTALHISLILVNHSLTQAATN